jgi:hypothetical protein
MKRYEAEIEDAKYKIKCYSDQELIIPSAEDKMAVMELHYGKIKAKEIS